MEKSKWNGVSQTSSSKKKVSERDARGQPGRKVVKTLGVGEYAGHGGQREKTGMNNREGWRKRPNMKRRDKGIS